MPRPLPGTWGWGHGAPVSTERRAAGVERTGPLGSQVSRTPVLLGPGKLSSACGGAAPEPSLPLHRGWQAPVAFPQGARYR